MQSALIEGPPATTSAASIRIPDIEALSVQPVIKVDLTTVQILKTGLIHEKAHSIIFQLMVTRLLAVEGHSIFKTRTATGFYEDP